jgi:hypothetical protein
MEALANWIPLTQTWAIIETICDVLSPIMTTCVINQCCGYWLLSDALAFTIKLYVKLSKERFELQVEIDAIEEMDMHMKMKQLVCQHAKASNYCFKAFLDFMFFFKPIKPHNMVALMLDPRFKDLSIVVDYVGHSFAIEIAIAYDKKFFLPTLKTLY